MEVLARFAAALWEPGDIIEIRAIHPAKDRGALSVWSDAGRLTECAEWGNKRNLDGFGIYAGANPRKDRGKSAADVALARCLFVDFDGVDVGTATALVADKCLPLPTVVVASGHGCHCWWRPAEPMMDLAEWSGRQQALIRLLGSDDKIKDAPRVMRLPGWWNTKEPRALVELVECEPSRVYGIDRFPNAVPQKHADYTGNHTLNGSAANLSRNTLLFVAAGAAEGERNDRLFKAAADFAGNGLDEGTAEARLLPIAVGCGLAEAEARQTIRSAYARPRTPARPVREGPVDEQDWGEAATDKPIRAASKPQFFNVFTEWREKQVKKRGKVVTEAVECTDYIPLTEIGDNLRKLTGGWPKVVGGLPFVVKPVAPGILPGPSAVRIMPRTADLFAWIGEATEPYWSEKACYSNAGKCSPPTKEEFLSDVKSSSESVEAVSCYPHEPPIPGVFYIPCELPTPTGERLAEFVARLNPETEKDRDLLYAMILTPFWGGKCGTRPAFVLRSRHGRGSGKTATAVAIADIAGGYFEIDKDEEWKDVQRRIMADDAIQQRITLIDNVRGKLDATYLESLVTARKITGWRMYVGNWTRPNYTTLFITSNSPKLSHDLSKRAVIIDIGRQRHSEGFVTWVEDFVAQHRAEMVAEIIAKLAGEKPGRISAGNRDRFLAWQDGVLCTMPNADSLAALIVERRAETDADAEIVDSIAKAIVDWLRSKSLDPGRKEPIKISRDEMFAALKGGGVLPSADMDKSRLHSWLVDKLGTDGTLAPLTDSKSRKDGRTWLWSGELWHPTEDDLPPV